MKPTPQIKPHIYKRDGRWLVDCKLSEMTGPYSTPDWARLAAAAMWEAYGPRRPVR